MTIVIIMRILWFAYTEFGGLYLVDLLVLTEGPLLSRPRCTSLERTRLTASLLLAPRR